MKLAPRITFARIVIAATFMLALSSAPMGQGDGLSFGFKPAQGEPGGGGGNAGGGGGNAGGGGGGGGGDNPIGSKGGIGAGGKSFGGFSAIGQPSHGSGSGSNVSTGGPEYGSFKNAPGEGPARGSSDLGNLNAARAAGYALGHPNPNSVVGEISAYRDAIQQGGLASLEEQRQALGKISNKQISYAEVARVNQLLGLPTPGY